MLFVKDANNLVAQYNLTEHGITLSSWIIKCRLFVMELTQHIDNLASCIAEFRRLEDRDSCLSLRYSSLICSTTLAQLYHVLARNPMSTTSSSSEFRHKCTDALMDVVNMARPLGAEDFRHMDPFLAVCWSRAIALFKNEKPSSPLAAFDPAASFIPSPWPSFDNQHAKDDRLEEIVMLISWSQDQFIRVRYYPSLTTLCQRMSRHDFRRNLNAPNYLQEDIKRFYGL